MLGGGELIDEYLERGMLRQKHTSGNVFTGSSFRRALSIVQILPSKQSTWEKNNLVFLRSSMEVHHPDAPRAHELDATLASCRAVR
jgi:hypothetical protein